MTFEEQLIITLIDKLAIGALILIGGLVGSYWLNQRLEEFKSKQVATFQIAKEKLELKQQILEKQLSDFYRPIRLRLEADNAIWKHMLGKYENDSITQTFGLAFEKTFILPNHDRIMEIIEQHGHLVGDDPKVVEEINYYTRHVAVYRALRAMDDKRDPVSFDKGLGWPKNFYPVIRERTVALQAEYDSLLKEYDSLLKNPSSSRL
jgi:hypothetical protein